MWHSDGPYQAWVTFLDRWGAEQPADAGGLPPLAPGDLPGDAWERLTRHLTAALSRRLTAWAQALTAALAGATDEFHVARTLHHGRLALEPIRALARHPGLPADLTARLLDAVETQVRSAQQGLEQGVERMRRDGADRSAVEARLRTVRENALTIAVPGGPAGGPGMDPWATDPAVRPRRRVAF